MENLQRGDFRMNMLCHTLMTDIQMETADIGPCLRPEVARAFSNMLMSIKDLDMVTTRFLEDAKGDG